MGETTAVAHGGDHGSRSWGKPPRPRCLPKTALHRFLPSIEIKYPTRITPRPCQHSELARPS
ncbi:MAG: hypothetical protein F6K44_11945 [Moorea sp. SIO3E2]|nr:hypothetical protein [Moorena sp. SIO3E2]